MNEKNRFAPIALVLLLLTLSGLAYILLRSVGGLENPYDLSRMPATTFSGLLALVFVGALSIVEFAARSRTFFRLAAAFKLILLCFLVDSLTLTDFEEAWIVCAFLLELAAYEGVGANLASALASALVITSVSWSRQAAPQGGATGLPRLLAELWPARSSHLLAYGIVASAGTALFYYRERAINAHARLDEVEGALKRLNEANIGYLNYSAAVSELSKVEERNRITRELHDIVGYSFVTNIMMLEAARDLVPKDQDRGVRLILETRDNLERGLTEIRKALYQWRVASSEPPMDLNKILQMVRIIEEVTNLEVDIDISAIANNLEGEIGLFLFNFLQETIVNSFLHGKARKVAVSLTRSDAAVFCRVTDDGVGAAAIKEGIGIQGIRERLGLLGGVLTLANRSYGFEVMAEIPNESPREGGEA
jgi:signal transduction histidine kinase